MRDERFKGHQKFSFEASLEDNCERVYGGEANEAAWRVLKADPGRSPKGVDTCRAEQHSAESRSEESGWLCLDNIRVCGMGV